ncbi:MAG: MFS transporter [Micrococcus sp.]|nr:MFS transporter [Micrococcus sp.]
MAASSSALPDLVGSERPTTTRAERRKAFVGASAGHLIEWYDYGVYGFLAVYVGAAFFSSDEPIFEILAAFGLFALSFFIRPLGGLFFGPLSDRIGRRKTLMWVLGLMCGATALIGMLPTAAQIGVLAPLLLVFLRLVQGFSAGGEISTITAFVSEYSAKGGRGLATSYLMITAAMGLMMGAVVANGLAWAIGSEAMYEWGWRLPFLLAGVLGAVAVYIRMKLEDSPEFKQLHAEKKLSKSPLRETLRYPRQLFLVAAIITLLGSSFYLVMTFMTTYMRNILELEAGPIFWLSIMAGVAAAVMMPVGGHLSDRMSDRRPMLIIGTIAVGVAVTWFFLVAPTADTLMGVALPLLVVGLATGLYTGVPYATMSELMPAHIRSTGIALGYNIPIAVFGGSAPFVATWLIATTGDDSSPKWFFLLTAVIALIGIVCIRKQDLMGHEDVAVTGSMDIINVPKQDDAVREDVSTHQR